MHELLARLVEGVRLTGNVRLDASTFLAHHGFPQTVDHSVRVAVEAERLAVRFGEDGRLAEVAGWLHDVSAVLPVERRARVARQLGLDVLPEEEAVPMIVHQRLSAVMARHIFGVADEPVLSAIGCHTTLKADASPLDKIVFVADKVAWDQPGAPPYLEGVLSGLERSLDQAALAYLRYLWQRRHTLAVVHPWFVDAYRQLSGVSAEIGCPLGHQMGGDVESKEVKGRTGCDEFERTG
jgi:predicted HD superfamily hydrolase involved in NAD metabolism